MSKYALVLFLFVESAINAAAQNATIDSYQRAREVVDRSFAAYGGVDAIRNISTLKIRMEGSDLHRNQSLRPGVPFQTPRIFELTMDLKKDRYRLYFERSGVGSYVVRSVELSDAKERQYADLRLRTKTTGPARPNWKETLPAQLLPQFVLLNGYGRIAQMRYLGRQTLNERPHDVVAYPGSGSTMLTLYFDTETGLISRQESLVSDSFAGDTTTQTVFKGYRVTGRFKVPDEAVISTAGVETMKLRYASVSFDLEVSDRDFAHEGELISAPTQPQPQTSTSPVQKLGENIYTASVPGYKVLFIALKDHIWAIEAPINDGTVRTIISQIRQTIPNKPIKYFAPTHFHDDHASGARGFVAEGATMVTTRGNRAHFEQLMKSRFTIQPDTLSRNPQPLKMEFIEDGKRVISDGVTTVELYEIGPSPHAEEMLVAYLPKERIVFQADLGDKPSAGPWIANPAIEHFAKWLKSSGLAVDQIVSAHGTFMTVADYELAMENAKQALSMK
jgi:glyoxylase-like metal-dependent hydrolase (beta-lactamase superfamily II)